MTEFNSKIKKNSHILKIFMFSLCALFACAISSHAQSFVKGTVTDGIGEPLPGVSVVVKGTTNGTITDVNGKYSIQATAKDILSFSYVGMSDQEIKVAGQTTINVVMKDDAVHPLWSGYIPQQNKCMATYLYVRTGHMYLPITV